MSRLLVIALWVVGASSACVEIEPEPPVDDEGEPIRLPGPYEPWLELVGVSPAPGKLSLAPTVSLTFNDYIEDDSFDTYAFGALSSGGVRVSGQARYVMTDKRVLWSPWSTLDHGLVYRFGITADVVSATDAPLLMPAQWPNFEASREGPAGTSMALPEAGWDEVEAIFEGGCIRCHRDSQRGLNPLTYDSLVGVKSRQTDLFLVRPSDAADSYLMRKLLWDYPDIEFTHQPPAWAGGEQLSREKLLLIEGWIASGARR